jgi:hypothetical protein
MEIDADTHGPISTYDGGMHRVARVPYDSHEPTRHHRSGRRTSAATLVFAASNR